MTTFIVRLDHESNRWKLEGSDMTSEDLGDLIGKINDRIVPVRNDVTVVMGKNEKEKQK